MNVDIYQILKLIINKIEHLTINYDNNKFITANLQFYNINI
jgi:hypothetical protein